MWFYIPTALLAASSLVSLSQARTLFKYERIQLTHEHLETLPAEDAKLFAFDAQAAPNTTASRCRYGPDDGKWPSAKAWTKFQKQLSSEDALIKAVPQASVCYGASKNDAKCQNLTKNWTNSYTHIDDPTEILSPIYQGLTCQPPSIYDSGNCTLGGSPTYVVKAKNVLDIQLGLNFARNNGVRLVVKNTGHDFAGKSTGAGALSLWTHGFKDIQFFDNYVDESGYRGPAIKAGAGIQAFELYKAANDHGVVVIAGEGQTVGVMGGYILGGGHSPLGSLYGMAADHVLGFEVVTPFGDFVSANSTSNPDLFWALRGGGGGSFGIVTSVTVKAYKDMPITAASWTLSSAKIGNDKFWSAVRAFADNFISYADSGIYTYFVILPNGNDFTFSIQPFFAPNRTASAVASILQSYSSKLTALNVPFSPKITEYKSFYSAWQAEFPLEALSDVRTALGSRLFPRSNFASETGRNVTFAALRGAVETGHPVIAFNIAPTLARAGNPDNAVNPAWRTSVLHAITTQSWEISASAVNITNARRAFTNGTMQKWRDVTPNSGSYLNEADRLEPNWQQSFWGDKYARLLSIKNEMDPNDVLWVNNGVGSEGWRVETKDGLPSENGQLCKDIQKAAAS
ncbi:FAD-binding domain-containing protein [Amniculicola lignicola CBS 123094]|uniref:FAD-binding domain-containing protein n=1 Tax=Amniculicola lignicola CBS 123094 TaxID=1392246 RepID=A0A6A5VW82_9PLEO|nr:FAD-binding domain-containing protein [Amniculicola lignicola CBS 123094]